MDFETRYAPEEEQEREQFRREVQAWLEKHVEGVGAPPMRAI